MPQLIAEGADVRAYDPAAGPQAKTFMPDLHVAESAAAAIAGADAALVLTEWNAFRSLPWGTMAPTMRRPLLIDLRNIYEPAEMLRQGMEYVPLGRADMEMAYRAAAE